jgi:hypothetical protein
LFVEYIFLEPVKYSSFLVCKIHLS